MTGIVAGELCAPGAVTVICPVYVPTASPDTAVVICSVNGAVPEPGDAESQLALVEAVKDSVPVPVLVIESSPGAGTADPCVYANDNEVGDTDKMG